ncbi:CRAL-TRIO domain-containing protein [Halteromyces radiatus]|uniref:CRAL-TRIO domain-containing protein n=1 Tax=Halteromyces radiatus TaxID=101107 RepID=UPI00221F3697|nr:CRAL-TRIO domain-containing protein [Halteromyces radiatus]KAI8096765.1 CRAL-TRIO domain-containing protein [Halteromyces radiatus]
MTNQFVKEFKPAEKEGVIQLKQDLPAILKEAFGSEDTYTLWGVTLDKESTDERLDVILVKFIRACSLSFPEARKMLVNTLKWRKEFKADELLTETFDQDLYGSIGYLHGKDKKGRPVCYNFYGDIDQETVFKDVQTFIRWRLQLMEKSVQLVDFINVDATIQVHDYRGASMFGRTANAKAATKELIKLLQDNYPEFLAIKFFVNVPWWGSKIFNLIKPLLPEATIKKFVVCSNSEMMTSLTKIIDQDQLPKVYTGDTEFKQGSVTAAIHAARQQEAKTDETLETTTAASAT